jgi:Ca2+-binding EF-hand superfamily protein
VHAEADTSLEFCKFCEQTEKELWKLFQTIDKDSNGRLDKSELASAFQRAGVAVSNARLDRFFSYIDKDHDGSIDYDEWRGKWLPAHLMAAHKSSEPECILLTKER